MAYLIIAALVFATCYGVDKGFSRLFRSRKEYRSGLAVKHQKRTVLFGVVLAVLGVAGILAGMGSSLGLVVLSAVVLLMAAGLIVYYLAFGIYYDAETFLTASCGKQSAVFSYGDIRSQKRYVIQGGAVLVELHMADGSSVGVQTTMDGALPFLDYAFARWCQHKGLDPDQCEFHDPGELRWFPEEEVR